MEDVEKVLSRKKSLVLLFGQSLFISLFLSLSANFSPVLAANTYDLSDSNNWNIQISGSESLDHGFASLYSKHFGDINNNGVNDLILCNWNASKQSRNHAGSCYIIYDSILSKYSGIGKTIDLNDTNNFNLRFDGPTAGSNLGYSMGATITDVNGNGKADILIPAPGAYILNWGSGAFYVILDDIIDDYTGVGNIIDLTENNNFSIRYDGHTSGGNKNYASEGVLLGVDVDNNGIDDIVAGAGHTGLAGRGRSGSLYIIYDSLIRSFSGRGNLVDLWEDENAYNLVYYNAAGSYFALFDDLIVEDFNNNGKVDIIIGSGYSDNASGTDTGSLYFISDDLIDNYSGTNKQIDLTNTNNFNWRIDGAGISDRLSYNGLGAGDLNNNGVKDIIVASAFADNNLRSNSGSVYVIFDSILSQYTSIGSTIDLADSHNYNIRFDGAFADSSLGYGMRDTIDVNNDGVNDLIIPASGDGNNNKEDSGSVYIIFNSKITTYLGTGNTVDLSDNTKYDIRYDGAVAGDLFGFTNYFDDFNDDGSIDLMFSALLIDLLGKTDNGGVYIIYNFPHAINLDSFNPGRVQYHAPSSFLGTVSAPNSVTNIKGLQYTFDNNAFGSAYWEDCKASDSSFDSKEEEFKCSQDFPTLKEGTHWAYFRSWDDNMTYTAQSSYQKIKFDIDYHEPYIRDLILKGCSDSKAEFLNPDYLDNSYDNGERFVYNLIYDKPKKNKDKIFKVYNLSDSEKTPSFTGWAYDKYKGGGTLNEKTFDSVATGPYELTLSLSKLNPNLNSSPNLISDVKEYGQYLNDKGITIPGTQTKKLYPYPDPLNLKAGDNNITSLEILSSDQKTYQPNITNFKLVAPSATSKYLPYQTIKYDLDSLYQEDIKEDLDPNLDPNLHTAKLDKKLRFTFTFPYSLIDGFYLANLKLTDKANNIFYYPSFFLSLNYKGGIEEESMGRTGNVLGETSEARSAGSENSEIPETSARSEKFFKPLNLKPLNFILLGILILAAVFIFSHKRTHHIFM